MPLKNYSRDALVQHCFEVANDNADEAARVLNRVVREQRDFLVRYACVPIGRQSSMQLQRYIIARFSAERWVASHLKNRHPGETYTRLLCRAYLLTPGMQLPESVAETLAIDVFCEEATRLIALKIPPRIHNFVIVRDDPVLGPRLKEIEDVYSPEIMRYSAYYGSLLSTLAHGLPPPDVVLRLVGPEAHAVYLQSLEALENTPGVDCDVDRALERGRERQQRRAALWSARDAQRSVDLLSLYQIGKSSGVSDIIIGDEYRQYREQHRPTRNSTLESASVNLSGLWRIRRSQSLQWRGELTDDLWRAYQKCEAVLQTELPRGVYSQIPRRHFNATSVQHMISTNLPALCDRLFINHLFSPAPP